MAKATRTIKVFCSPDEQAGLAERYEILERYDAFALLQATPKQLDTISRSYPTEDISDDFELRVFGRKIRSKSTKEPGAGRAGKAAAMYKRAKAPSSGEHHYLVQFIGPIKSTWLRALRRHGAEPREPIADYTYVVRADEHALAAIKALPYVRRFQHFSHKDRIDLGVAGDPLPRTRQLADTFRVEFFGADDLRRGERAVKRTGAEIVNADARAGVMTVKLPEAKAKKRRALEQISAVHGVRTVRRFALKRPSNDVATTLMTTARALSTQVGLSGAGEIIAVCDTGIDTGRPDDVHPDFRGRIAAIKSYPITAEFRQWIHNPGANDGAADLDSGHGTHVAGSVLGSGTASAGIAGQTARIRGLAHGAKLVFQAVEQELDWKDPKDTLRYGRYLLAGIPTDITELFEFAYGKGARIHSNSWGGGAPGEYDAQCRQLDAFTFAHRDFCVLVAAGNDGTDKDGDGLINNGSVTSPGTAKNCITVGASERLRREFDGELYGNWWPEDYPVSPYRHAPMANGPSQVVPFSSRGPTRDGRVKPDVVAPGTFILSARSRLISPTNHGWAAFPASRDYFYMGGTSMATPLTAGAVALIREFLRTWVGFDKPSAALIKACLIGGATKLPGGSGLSVVLDNQQGYGLVNIDNIVAPAGGRTAWFVEEGRGLETGKSDAIKLDVQTSEQPLRVALAYTDYPGPSLVNNLNLMLTSPTGVRHVGNADGGPTQRFDIRSNAEVIEVHAPAKGRWTLEVIGSNVPQGPQSYALFVSGNVKL
jgi:serine protease AprX